MENGRHGDVYKRQEIELIRNRPSGYHNFPMSENRERLNFRQYKRKPMEFLARIEEYLEKHRGNQWVQNREILDESFREVNDHWSVSYTHLDVYKRQVVAVPYIVSYQILSCL